MNDKPNPRDERESDAPADLSRDRATFVRQFLKRGVEITESLLDENKQLQAQLAELEDQNSRLRAQVASDDAIRDLLRTIEMLESERKGLLERSTRLEVTRRESDQRNAEVEQELHDLANLYIASSHLHSTLSARGVMRHLEELLQQLVGAEIFVIYLVRDGQAVPVRGGAIDIDTIPPVRGEGVVGEVMMTGIARIAETPKPGGSLDAPIAVIPMMARDRVVGVITIATVFDQKTAWAAVDHELFNLLGSHAATALIAANLYTTDPNAARALDGLIEQLNP